VRALRAQPGCLGAALLVKRTTGRSASVTSWVSQAALDERDQAANEAEVGSIRAAGGWLLQVDRYEVVVWEQWTPPEADVFVRVAEARGVPGRLDETVLFLRQQVVPALKGRRGSQAVVGGVNRETGRWLVLSTWDTLRDLHAGAAALTELRRRGGADAVTVDIFEVAVVEAWSTS
jgi:hypothetical protein